MRRARRSAGPSSRDQLVAPAAQLVDGEVDPLAGAGEQPDLLEHDERRDGERADAGPGLRDGRRARRITRRAPAGGQVGQLAALGDGHDAGALDGGGRAASTVSSVSPENETANTSDASPTKAGSS